MYNIALVYQFPPVFIQKAKTQLVQPPYQQFINVNLSGVKFLLYFQDT